MAATFPLIGERERDYAIRMIMRTALDGKHEVVIRRATRNKKQNALLHAALSDIAEQLAWPPPPANSGTMQDIEVWKRRCTLGWMIEESKGGEVIVPLYEEDKDRFGILVPHTSDLPADDMASLVEWTFSFGATNGVIFKKAAKREEPPPPNPGDYR